MSMVLATQSMSKLKTALQSNKLYLIGFILIGLFSIFTIFVKEHKSLYDIETDSIEGKVISYKIKNNCLKMTINGKEKVVANYYFEDEEFSSLIGADVKLTGEFKTPINNTIPNTFNYKNYLYHEGIYYTFNAKSIKIDKSSQINYRFKNYVYDLAIRQDEKVTTYLNLFILGNKNYLDSEMYQTYQSNGISHLFAISGMHLGVLILGLNYFLKRVRYRNVYISITLWIYAFLVSFSSSVVRATLFISIKTFLDLLDIKLDNKKILYLTAFTLMAINPFNIYDIGFIYSFLTTYAIFKYTQKLTGNYVTKILKTSLITLLYSLPVTVSLNYEINILSIILNIIYIPLVTVIVYPLSIITFFMPFLGSIFKFFINLLETSNNFFQEIDLFKIIVPKLSILFILFYYLILEISYKKENLKIMLVILIVFYKLLVKLDNNYYVYYLDIGQGDSSVIVSPHRKEVIMIDTGGNLVYDKNSYYKTDNTIKFLKSLGIKKIDLLVISHGDSDHGGDAPHLIDNFEVESVLLNKNKLNNLEKVIKGKVPYKNTNFKYFKLKNINDYLSDDENYSSIITYLEIYDNKFMFMGDAPKEVEKLLKKDYEIECDFLKVGHHGSKTSSDEEFLKYTNPKLAIISSGRNNLYHHPSKEVTNSLNKLNINYLNTQTSGTIMFKINQTSSTILEYKP